MVHQIGPGMAQQMQTHCTECGGTGEMIAAQDRCKVCGGKKVIKEKKFLEVYIEKGMKHGQKITFSGEADEEPGILPGDVVLVLVQKPHTVFKRNGEDLLIEQTIPLVHALTGCAFAITHLDGRQLLVKTEKGDIIEPGETRTIEGEGMPHHKNPFLKGNLEVKITVEFPKAGTLPEDTLALLERILPPAPPLPPLSDDAEHVSLSKISPYQKMHHQNRRESYEEDEEDEGHGGGSQRVQCAQQ